jgi:PadR family transcriptional regulator, regulatory protein PadR
LASLHLERGPRWRGAGLSWTALLHVCTLRIVAGIQRVTRPLVVLLAVLLHAYMNDEELHGYALMRLAHLSGPSTYRNLDRLEDADLVEMRWEDLPPGEERPRRIYYRLSPTGAAVARKIVAERRPDLLQNPPRPTLAPAPRPGISTFIRAFPGRAEGAR